MAGTIGQKWPTCRVDRVWIPLHSPLWKLKEIYLHTCFVLSVEQFLKVSSWTSLTTAKSYIFLFAAHGNQILCASDTLYFN
jgi:hypothetical protein